MTFQPSKKKSLSERFGDLSSWSTDNCNKDFKNHIPTSENVKPGECYTGDNRSNDQTTGNLTVHLKINQVNRQRKESNYVNRPCQPLRMNYCDKPSDFTKQFNKNGFNEGKENNRKSYNQGFGRQISVKDTPINAKCENYSTSRNSNQISPTYGANQTYSRFNQNSQSDPRINNQTSPRYNSGNQTSPRYNSANQTSPRYNSANQTSPRYNSGNQTSPRINNNKSYNRFNNGNQTYNGNSQISPRLNHTNKASPAFKSNNQTFNRFNNPCQITTQYTKTDQISPPLNDRKPPSPHYNWDNALMPSKNGTDINNDFQQQRRNSYPPSNLKNFDFGSIEKSCDQWSNNGDNKDLFSKNFQRNQKNNCMPPNKTGFTENTMGTGQDSQGRFMGNYMNSDQNTRIKHLSESNFKRNSDNFNNHSHSANSAHQNFSFKSSAVLHMSNSENIMPGKHTDQSVGCNNLYHRIDVTSRDNVQTLNKDPRTSINGKYSNESKYNTADQVYNNGKLNYGLNNNIVSSGDSVYTNKSSNPMPGSYEDQPYSPNQMIGTPVHKEPSLQHGPVSPTFSSDSEVCKELNQFSSESNSSQQSNSSYKLKGFYIDLSKELSEIEALKKKVVEEREVEALKKKFFKQCESLVSTSEDKKTMEVVKKSLQIVPGSSLEAAINRQHSLLPKLVIDEKKKEEDDSSSTYSEDGKFEGRTLLKGGVKPRHIPKMLTDKPGLDPPVDRRTAYLTARNLLELPLPKWAAEHLGKCVLEQDISKGLNKEKTPVKQKDKTKESELPVKQKDKTKESELDKRLTEIFDIQTVDSRKNVKISPSNDQKEKIHVSVDMETSCNNKTVTCGSKRSNTDNTTANKDVIVNKKMKVEKTADSMLRGNVMNKNVTTGIVDNNVNGKPKMKGMSQSSKRERSISRDSSRSDRSRFRDTSRSRNRSNSRSGNRSAARSDNRSSSRSRKRSRSRDRFYQRTGNNTDKRYSNRSGNRNGDSRKRSPVKSDNKGFKYHQSSAENIMSSIASRGQPFKDAKLRHDDLYGYDGNKFRTSEGDFHSMECR